MMIHLAKTKQVVFCNPHSKLKEFVQKSKIIVRERHNNCHGNIVYVMEPDVKSNMRTVNKDNLNKNTTICFGY